MIRTLEEWVEIISNNGTSGDQVPDIIMSWRTQEIKNAITIHTLRTALSDCLALIEEHGDRTMKAHATRIMSYRDALRTTK